MAGLQNQLSHNQQQLLDAQKSDEELIASNSCLQNQLSLTQQQLLGVQSMITCKVVSNNHFTVGKEIGRGAWATVHTATFQGATVAVKRLHQFITAPRTIQLFQREMEMVFVSTSEYCYLPGSYIRRSPSYLDGIDGY